MGTHLLLLFGRRCGTSATRSCVFPYTALKVQRILVSALEQKRTYDARMATVRSGDMQRRVSLLVLPVGAGPSE